MKTIFLSLILALSTSLSAFGATIVTTLAELNSLDWGTEFEFVGKAMILADAPYFTTLLTDEEGTVLLVYGAGGLQPGLVITGFTGEKPGEDDSAVGYGGFMIQVDKQSIIKSDIIETFIPILADPEKGFNFYDDYQLVEFGAITVTEHSEFPENYAYVTLDNGSTCTICKWLFEGGSGRYESITGVYIGNKIVPFLQVFAVHSVGPKIDENNIEGVETIAVDANSGKATYYNLQGQRIVNPTGNQMLIEVNGDGSVRKIFK